MHRAPCSLFPAACSLLLACADKDGTGRAVAVVQGRGQRLDTFPVMLNKEPPFRHPRSLYAKKAQGDVTLRLFIDTLGNVNPDSTQVVKTSGFTAFDSAAIEGSRALRFSPAWRDGKPVALTILFPVLFRHPDAPPLPGDTILKRRAAGRGEPPPKSP